jgi:DedD protein
MAESRDINVDEMRRRARRRLVGAIVLALGAAVIVPMLLENDPKPLGEEVSVRIPPVDDGKFVNKLTEKAKSDAANSSASKATAPRDAPKVDVPVTPDAPAKADAPSGASNAALPRKSLAQAEHKVLSAPATTVAAPSAVAPTTSVPAPAPAPALAATSVATATAPPVPAAAANSPASVAAPADATAAGFSVQLAAFADDKGANSLSNKLKKAGYPAYTEPLTTSKGTLWRVRVGPYPAREDALDIRNKLKTEGYSGIVAAK